MARTGTLSVFVERAGAFVEHTAALALLACTTRVSPRTASVAAAALVVALVLVARAPRGDVGVVGDYATLATFCADQLAATRGVCGSTHVVGSERVYCLTSTDDDDDDDDGALALLAPLEIAATSRARFVDVTESDVPCADTPQQRRRAETVRVTFRNAAPVVVRGARAFCVAHLHEVVRVGWTCPAPAGTASP